jgi:AraC-like DNA-binding protein
VHSIDVISKVYKIKDIAKNVGYANQLYFSNEFKKYYGVYPTEMKKH